MQEISICPEDIQYAREKAIEMGRINNSITKGEGNIAGFLGEIIVSNLLTSVGIKNKVHNTYNYDIVCNDITIDVKTKRTKMKPRDYYECSIAKTSTHQKCTHYVFTRILNDFSKAWILGWMEHAEYFKKARFLKKGDKDGDNNFIVKADCYNVSIEDLNNISELGTKTVDTLNQVVYTDGVVDTHNINSHNGVALNTRKINMPPIQPLYLTGKCYWASVVEPNSTFEPAWQVDLCLDADTKALVEGAGLNVRNKEDERGEFVTLKRKVQGKNGPRSAPTVVDSQNNPWDKKLIGNGSVVTVKALPFEWNYAGKAGVSADLAAVQVVELIEYGDDKDFEVVEGGYVNDAASQMADLESDDIPFGN